MIRLLDVTRRFRVGPTVVDALCGVSLTVGAGERVAVTGKSGSGKTTLVQILALVDLPTGGAYFLAGRDVASLDDDGLSAQRNRSIGLVVQTLNLIPQRSCLENVALPLIYRGMTRVQARAEARAALLRVGMADRAESRASTLSGGQQQRVAIARAIVGEPPLLIADEPTGSLDRGAALEVLDVLLRLNEEGTTLVLVTHDPGVAERVGRTVELSGGRLSSEGLR